MKHFAPLLRSINDRLNIQQPTKSRILLEIAADLEDTYQFYCTKGLSTKEAKQKAEEKYDFTDAALGELVQIHQSYFKRLMDRLSTQAQTRMERIVLLLVLLFIAGISIKTVFTTQFILQASRFVWPILGISFGIIIIFLIKFYSLQIKQNHNIKQLRTGLSSILGLGGINLIVGILGYLVELFHSSRTTTYSGLFDVITTVVESGDDLFFHAVDRILKCASMAMVCTSVTIFTALIWFFLINKVKKIEQAEAAILLET